MRILLMLIFPRIAFTYDGICVVPQTIINYVRFNDEVLKKERDVPGEVCCSGYENVSGKCVPICEPKCFSGTCSKPQKCECDEGWTGPLCAEIALVCKPGRWGADCEFHCDCDSGYCSQTTGKCDQTELILNNNSNRGFHGRSFGRSVCPEGFWGNDCSNACRLGCENNKCDLQTGECKVLQPSTEAQCFCKMENVEFCNNGKCKCKRGWTGDECENACEEGYYGENCESKCTYYGFVNYICDPINGDMCNYNYHGENCDICKCENGICNSLTGECDCDLGFEGNHCSFPCEPNKYGKKCSFDCNCNDCRKTDGYCKCQGGWRGNECSDYCPNDLHNKTSGLCFNRPSSGILISWPQLTCIGGTVVILIFIIIIGMMVFNKWTKRNFKEDLMMTTNAPKINVPPDNPITISSLNPCDEEDHIYAIIPDGSIAPEYSQIIRFDEKVHEVPYFQGYEEPKGIPQSSGSKVVSGDKT